MNDHTERNITQRPTATGPAYTAQVRIAGAKPISKTFRSFDKARQWRNDEEKKIRELLRRGPDSRQFWNERLHDTLVKYLERGNPTQKDAAHLKSAIPHLQNAKNGDIRKKWCREYWERMSRKTTCRKTLYKAGTVAKHFAAMRAAFLWRAEDMDTDIQKAPFHTAVLPKGWATRRTRRLERGEEAALRTAMRAYGRNSQAWLPLMTLALETGARLQEMVLATWSEFDLTPGREYWQIPDKHSKTGRRSVPLSPRAVEAVRELKALMKPGERRLVWNYKNSDCASQAFATISERAGLDDFHFHDLRHEAISRFVADRPWMSYRTLGAMVGHSTADITDRYSHLRPEELISAFKGPADWQLRLVKRASANSAGPAFSQGGARADAANRSQAAATGGGEQALSRKGVREARELAIAA